jgi:hypothetical protein
VFTFILSAQRGRSQVASRQIELGLTGYHVADALPDIANIMVDVISQDAVIAFVDFNDATGSSGTQTIRLLPISRTCDSYLWIPHSLLAPTFPSTEGILCKYVDIR